ncbi:type II toxin-antitoxin system HipA family toxin [Pseudorhodoferax soli]|uniref:Serine/threonine-protein kinase HipA n=1 Tax=Pseudorhodoferax soli TaxID=545864 RepID=A0A368XPN2_9BURK|nr:type II toxin-antitoxin system HipA family toxin [Pseudorhodoferax soli]RCW69489.1 serine/threonine-protein kinase HipA [Pseudorhodoferax soli]
MDLSILEITLLDPTGGDHLVGHLFRYGHAQPNGLIRFVPAPAYVRNPARFTLSQLYLGTDEDGTQRLLSDIAAAEFNGLRAPPSRTDTRGPLRLPHWFQNLLPEGAFRAHIAAIRGCDEDDYFELLAACGTDLPGAVRALPVNNASNALMQRLVTQDQDALEASVIEIPLAEGVSLSGVQPKLGVNLDAQGRYVARTKLDEATHIIAKLPVVGYPRMPEVEHLSMHLAGLAGVRVCKTSLVPLQALSARHSYDLGSPDPDRTMFLAVPRYDRDVPGRRHAEDLAQALGLRPEDKYSKSVSYAAIMLLFLAIPSLGESAVLELLRRLAVNELIGNPDCHLKNIGLYYPDGVNAELPPAYDIVAHHLFTPARGHALYLMPKGVQDEIQETSQRKIEREFRQLHGREPGANELPRAPIRLLNPVTIKRMAQLLQLPGKLLETTLKHVVAAAANEWPAAIDASDITPEQKQKMKDLLEEQPAVQALRRRRETSRSKASSVPLRPQ